MSTDHNIGKSTTKNIPQSIHDRLNIMFLLEHQLKIQELETRPEATETVCKCEEMNGVYITVDAASPSSREHLINSSTEHILKHPGSKQNQRKARFNVYVI